MPLIREQLKMPTPPGVVVRLLELTEQDFASVQEIADAIALDPALAAKILKFANSPLAGIRREVTSLPRAVALMGTRGVMMTALSFAVVGSTKIESCDGFDMRQFGVQSICCGVAAKLLATESKVAPPQEAMLAGLLSQLGRPVLANADPAAYAAILQKAPRIPQDLPELEQKALETDYAQIGSEVLESWKLPPLVWQAIRTFRKPVDHPNRTPLADIIHVAELAAGMICPDGTQKQGGGSDFKRFAIERLDLDEDTCESLACEIAEETEALRVSLEVAPGNIISGDDLKDILQDRITELNMAMHFESQSMVDEQEDLLRKASTDALTGVGNRAAFDTRLTHEIDRANRSGASLGLIMLDVDLFKQFNDNYGHQAGDEVLKATANVIRESIRKVDYVARYGGEEFAIIAPGLTGNGAVTLAERLRSMVADQGVQWEQHKLHVTISVGVAVITEYIEPEEAKRFIRAADECLYAAKRDGRNKCMYSINGRMFRQKQTAS
ncbi:MAG: sensor domain-containing diguanylate cyclase [Phycisphaerae bacterium]